MASAATACANSTPAYSNRWPHYPPVTTRLVASDTASSTLLAAVLSSTATGLGAKRTAGVRTSGYIFGCREYIRQSGRVTPRILVGRTWLETG
jgi:hypothetical protein